MIEELLPAVKSGRIWTDRFTRFEYRQAFQEYVNKYSEMFIKEISSYSSMDVFSDAFIGLIAGAIKKERFFSRSACRIDCKMTIVAFLCPMLEKKLGKEFAEAICSSWNNEFSGECISSTDYESLLNGFRNSVLGIDFENKHNNV